MLKSIKKLDDTIFSLEIVLEGKDYQEALQNYLEYVPDYLQPSYDNKLFAKGQTPIVVNEETHGDSIYRYIFEAKFQELYIDAIASANVDYAVLRKVEFVNFSKERVVLNAIVETNGDKSLETMKKMAAEGIVDVDIQEVLKSALSEISNVDMLAINNPVARDEYFWKDLQDECSAFEKSLSQELMPILSQLGVVEFSGGSVRVDISDSNPMRFMYPIIELSLFPSAVFAAALHEYIPNFTKEDERNLKKYVFSCADQILSLGDQLGSKNKKVFNDRLMEYATACKEEILCGYSLYGQFGMDYDGLRGWTKNHQVKCAHILCDHMIYIKTFKDLATIDDLQLLKPIVEKNTQQDLNKIMKLFKKLHTTAGAIYMIVRGALNGSRKIKWKKEGLCQYCGREFKKSLFGTKCPVCKIKKDY